MPRLTIALLLLVGLIHASVVQLDDFNSWKSNNGKRYGNSDQETKAKLNFKSNEDRIKNHNNHRGKGHTEKMNKFGDLSPQEFAAQMLTLDKSKKKEDKKLKVEPPGKGQDKRNERANKRLLQTDPFSVSINWITQGGVTTVKDQGWCGSCWAFAIVASYESENLLHGTGSFEDYSEQQLVSCSPYDGGCNGGWIVGGYFYTYYQGGIQRESTYPYTATDTACAHDATKAAFQLRAYATPYGCA